MKNFSNNYVENNTKDKSSKIKGESYFSAYKNNILIQKCKNKKDIYFATNYYIDTDNLRNTYKIKNRGIDIFV